MQWCPPINMSTIDKGGPQIIIDPALALDLHGPLFTLRLSQECDTWVPSSVWRALDESLVNMVPVLVATEAQPLTAERPPYERVAMVWERVRILTAGRRLYWLAERRDDAHLPDWVTPESFTRFETLLEAFETGSGDKADTEMLDALVLAAALQERAVAILCPSGSEDGMPGLVEAAQTRGFATRQLSGEISTQLCAQWFWPLLTRAGLFEWVRADQMPLAFVRVIAPELLFLDTQDFNSELRLSPGLADWPSSATVLWGRL
ncbi:MAG: hypothetical protein OIF40_16505 [Mangrovicoccus sp.]|nr:hypothetical protein [Mangrovicoccus sp.]